MNSTIRKVIKAKDYKTISFRTNDKTGETLYDRRNEWIVNNPEAIIFNTHVLVINDRLTHIIEYV